MNPETFHAIVRGDRRGPLAFAARLGLRLASGPYGLGVRFRNLGFDRGWKHTFTAAVPVVSIGNLTLGGTGKTPCVEFVARLFRDLDIRPVILSRGYGSEQGRNDEAMVLEENVPDVPHLQNPDRVALAMTAVEELDAEVLILDDGFQHRRLKRNLDIVLIDATRPLNREALFPRGLLREPIGGLKRAQILVLTRCDQATTADEQAEWLKQRFPNRIVAKAIHQPTELMGLDGASEPLDRLRSTPVAAFCGIGNPESFRETLSALGGAPLAFRKYPDHHAYTRDDVRSLQQWADELPKDATVVTTQKDWVKLRLADLNGRPLWALRIGFEIGEGETEFAAAVRGIANLTTPND